MIDRRTGSRISLLILVVMVFVIPFLVGCKGEETPVSPNEKTAAPARLPGENVKSSTDRTLTPGSK
jgi:hypothetical protein